MKNLILCCFAVLIAMPFSSCKKDKETSATGTWQYEYYEPNVSASSSDPILSAVLADRIYNVVQETMGLRLTLRKNGTGASGTKEFTYTYAEQWLTVTYPDSKTWGCRATFTQDGKYMKLAVDVTSAITSNPETMSYIHGHFGEDAEVNYVKAVVYYLRQ